MGCDVSPLTASPVVLEGDAFERFTDYYLVQTSGIWRE